MDAAEVKNESKEKEITEETPKQEKKEEPIESVACPAKETKRHSTTVGAKLFGKYDYNVTIADASLGQYISLKQLRYPHSFARHANKQFEKSKVNVVERLANKLMRGGTGEKLGGRVIRTHGKLQGKKAKVLKIIETAFDEISIKTKQNPLQLLVKAIENSAPREDITRVRFGGISYQISVDISAQRRLDLALKNIALTAIMGSFDKKTTLAEALANEIISASANSPDSYAVKRKNEAERMARSAR
ncbi:30S ribosomal protein S7 [Candidatus Micrarchaeota archaeon]|nr:30S ribosomal protein S7 [Candidatus Micrarchaeota archaeon]